MDISKIKPLLNSLDLFGQLPYFRGKGRLVVWLLRLLNSSGPLPIRLPDGSRILMSQKGLELIAYFWLGKHQPEFTRIFWQVVCMLPTGHSVIDVGAHIGYYSLMAAHCLQRAGRGMVFAFEPHPQNFADLQRNKALNKLDNLIPIRKAVADQSGQVTLFSSPLSGAHSLRQQPLHDHSYEVECTTLDSFMASHTETKVGLIKIDAEGADLLVLYGAKQTIERDKPYILFEENEERGAFFGYSVQSARSFLQNLGYTVRTLRDENVDNAVAVPEGQDINFLQ